MEITTSLTRSRGHQGTDSIKNQPFTSPHNSLNNRTTSQQSSKHPVDTIRLSREARHLAAQRLDTGTQEKNDRTDIASRSTPPSAAITAGAKDLSSEELTRLMELQKRDAEVRAHEQAHLSRAGQHAAGGAAFSYTTGPDGVRYATAGEVPIDISKEETPRETIDKMQQVKSAALAPATPSSADRRIAAKATTIAAQARQELHMESTSESTENSNETESPHNAEEKTSPTAPQHPSFTKGNDSQSNSGDFTTAARHMVLQMYAAQSQ